MKIKAFLIAIVAMIATISIQAQSMEVFSKNNSTLTNADTLDLVWKKKAGAANLSIQVINTRVSGTVAGKTFLEQSLDNVTFVKIDSITNANKAVNTKIFNVTSPQGLYYRIRNVGSGTMSYKSKAYAHLNRY